MRITDILGSLAIAFAMYSGIPVPQVAWSEKKMKYALCFFPAVGIVIGAALVVWKWLADRLGISEPAFACIAAALPLLITGGIHMDGYLDTVDARSSHLDREQKLAILKDPHAGAFAIISGGVYLLLTVGLLCELDLASAYEYAGCFVLSRALSAWALVSWPKARDDGLAKTFSSMADKKRVRTAMLIWLLSAVLWLLVSGGIMTGICCAAGAVLAMLWYFLAKREFGGVTGDLAGYFLQICELCLLAAIIAEGLIVG